MNPNDANAFVISVYSGEVQVDSGVSMSEAGVDMIPSRTKLFSIVAKDPCAAQRYFDRMIEIFFQDVLGFDKTSRRPLKEGGVFGYCDGYYGMVETQGRGTLHMHALIWIRGSPKTSSEYIAKCSDAKNGESYRGELLKYVDSVIQSDTMLSMDELECPKCQHASCMIPIYSS